MPDSPAAPASPYQTYTDAANSTIDDLKNTYSTLNAPVSTAQSSLNDAQQKLIGYYSGLTNPVDRYNQLYASQGIGAAQTEADNYQKGVLNTQNSIDDLKGNVNKSTSPFLMSQADRDLYYNHELEPLTTTLQQNQRGQEMAQVGLSGKMDSLKYLTQLYDTADQEGAKPFQLGVDFGTSNLSNAKDTYKTAADQAYQLAQTKLSGTTNDLKAYQDAQATQQQQQFSNQQRIASAQDAANLQAQKTTTDTKAQTAATNAMWSSIQSNPKINSEYDAWKYIKDNWSQIQASGVDPNQLMALHDSYAAKYGTDAPIRPGATAGARYKSS